MEENTKTITFTDAEVKFMFGLIMQVGYYLPKYSNDPNFKDMSKAVVDKLFSNVQETA